MGLGALMLVMTEESVHTSHTAEIDCDWHNKIITFNFIPGEAQFSHFVSWAFHLMGTNDSNRIFAEKQSKQLCTRKSIHMYSRQLNIGTLHKEPLLQLLLDTSSAVVSHRLIGPREAPSRAGSGSTLPCEGPGVIPCLGAPSLQHHGTEPCHLQQSRIIRVAGNRWSLLCGVRKGPFASVSEKERHRKNSKDYSLRRKYPWITMLKAQAHLFLCTNTKWQGLLAESSKWP